MPQFIITMSDLDEKVITAYMICTNAYNKQKIGQISKSVPVTRYIGCPVPVPFIDADSNVQSGS